MMQIKINSLEEITAAAQTFLTALSQSGAGSVIAFYGGMGAGKTTFITALCRELGVTEPVTSPTFAIVNEYSLTSHLSPLTSKIFHFDFYRIKKLEEVYDMGFEDYFYSGALCLIEWPELIEEVLPEDAVKVSIKEKEDGSRAILF